MATQTLNLDRLRIELDSVVAIARKSAQEDQLFQLLTTAAGELSTETQPRLIEAVVTRSPARGPHTSRGDMERQIAFICELVTDGEERTGAELYRELFDAFAEIRQRQSPQSTAMGRIKQACRSGGVRCTSREIDHENCDWNDITFTFADTFELGDSNLTDSRWKGVRRRWRSA